MQAELLQDFFWVRIDFPAKSHHHFFRYDSTAVQAQEILSAKETTINYAAGH